jgi:hypothetical protein
MQHMRTTTPRPRRLIEDTEFPESFLPRRIAQAATAEAEAVLREDRQLRHLLRELGL